VARATRIVADYNLPGAVMLVVFGGLPGTGKTTIAQEIARRFQAVYLRIDTIEQALRSAAGPIVGVEGYAVAYALAAENLKFGRIVVADCVNPLPVTRNAWRAAARQTSSKLVEIELVCSDRIEHRRRVESRVADIPGHVLPSWDAVLRHGYVTWSEPRLVLDTTLLDISNAVRTVSEKIVAEMR